MPEAGEAGVTVFIQESMPGRRRARQEAAGQAGGPGRGGPGRSYSFDTSRWQAGGGPGRRRRARQEGQAEEG